MAITADLTLHNGIALTDCYIIIPVVYVKKFTSGENEGNPEFKLIYDASIFKDATERVGCSPSKMLGCPSVHHFKIDYDPTTTDNPFVLAYTHLKTNNNLSNVADA
tara:strand:+ start:1180 stop:1497 length:318 start_codon:yes stop_codon:yes gene_type:complete